MKLKAFLNIIFATIFSALSSMMFVILSKYKGITVIDNTGEAIKLFNIEVISSVASKDIFSRRVVFFLLAVLFLLVALYNIYRAVIRFIRHNKNKLA